MVVTFLPSLLTCLMGGASPRWRERGGDGTTGDWSVLGGMGPGGRGMGGATSGGVTQ